MLDQEKEYILSQKLTIDIHTFDNLSQEEKRKVILQFKQEKTMYWQLIAAQLYIALVVVSALIAFIYWAFILHGR